MRVGGGVDLRRMSVMETDVETLVGLDERFTPDGMSVDRYTMTADPDGILLFEACADRDGCRLWEVPPGRPAPNPTTLPRGTPKVCSAIGASRQWLVVYDLDGCFVDTGDGAMPIRAISRAEGTSHVVDGTHLLARRVVELDGATLVVASERGPDWSTTDIVTIEVASRARQRHARSLPNLHDGSEGWLGVSPISLPGSWVLVEPWGVEPGGTSDGIVPAARLLDLATNDLIELLPNTFGWR